MPMTITIEPEQLIRSATPQQNKQLFLALLDWFESDCPSEYEQIKQLITRQFRFSPSELQPVELDEQNPEHKILLTRLEQALADPLGTQIVFED